MTDITAPENEKDNTTPTYSQQEVEKIMKARVKQAEEAKENMRIDYENRIADLEKKLAGMQPPTNQNNQTGQGVPSPQNGIPTMNGMQNNNQTQNPNMIPADVLPQLGKYMEKVVNFNNKMTDALQKDKEFDDLAKNSPNHITPEMLHYMLDTENAPQLVKHLLKDKNDYQDLVAAYRYAQNTNNDYELVKQVNTLSRKLNQSAATKPHPSPFEPDENLSDVGDGGQDFDTHSYARKIMHGG